MKSLKYDAQIQTIKSTFTQYLTHYLNLTAISAPLIVFEDTGLNDDLNGIEQAVRVKASTMPSKKVVIVHSLAKWKRWRLGQYEIAPGLGILTDMKALRADETLDATHSIYVDQWDWEKVMLPEQRNLAFLKETVSTVYDAITATAKELQVKKQLPDQIYFISSEQLLMRFPLLTPKERENEICKLHQAVCIIGIGSPLTNGIPHDDRACDYDDWTTKHDEGVGLNADILIWHEPLQQALEISSMGIRVDAIALQKQVALHECANRLKTPYHRAIMTQQLPQTIGGGIGQSRLCMLLLEKQHIGEVQVSVWSDDVMKHVEEANIQLM